MKTKVLTKTAMAVALVAGIGVAGVGGIQVANAAKQGEKRLVAMPYNNPAEAKKAGFPATALNVNRTADGRLSWMMTPQEMARQETFNKQYLKPAKNLMAASLADGQEMKVSSSLFGIADSSTTVVSGLALQPQTGATQYTKDNSIHTSPFTGTGRLTCTSGEPADEFTAQVQLPSGALVTGLTAYGNDTSAADNVGHHLMRTCNVANAQGTATEVAVATATAGFIGGNYAVNSAAVSHTVDNTDCTYYVEADMSGGTCDGLTSVYQVAVRWKRQISPDPATTTFTDVPLSHPFHREVEAMVSSGITGGCGGGNFCPNSNVTRGQMAAFLSRALGLHWESN